MSDEPTNHVIYAGGGGGGMIHSPRSSQLTLDLLDPALREVATEILLAAVRRASELGVHVSARYTYQGQTLGGVGVSTSVVSVNPSGTGEG